MVGNALDEGSSTSKGAYNCDVLIIKDLIKDIINRISGIVDDSVEPMDISNPDLTREDKITDVKKRPLERKNKAKERKILLNVGEKMHK